MQIIVKQISGLGNQLFQYAAGQYYAKRYEADLRVAIDAGRTAMSHGAFPRPFLLSHFSLTAPFGKLTMRDRAILSENSYFKVASAPFRKALGIEVFAEAVSQRYRFLPVLPIEPGINTLYLTGYWQSHRLVEGVASKLRSEFAFSGPAQGQNLSVLRQIKATANSVSLHMRRGDYTLAAEGNIALPNSYYSEAVALLKCRLHQPTFFIFSDDIAYAKENLPEGIRKVFVEHNDDFSSHEDLRLMSSCSHHIIANSTFSWWGAWLNESHEKIVVAPRHWQLTEESFFPDLLPPEWLLLDSLR